LACHRLPICRQEYLGRLSGPLLDRFDLRVNVPPVPLFEMMGGEKGEASTDIAARVGAAREVQMARQNCLNAHLDGEALYQHGAPDSAGQSLLDRIADTKKLSARGFNRILRVARTLADLDHRDSPNAENIATAIRWRDVAL
ncbi:MAG TPA: AAA family ATPase, partial [Rhodobiaceae bacterium]|nr:AAA family ATPase [Rhodobiaceae bacterium]